MWQDGAALVLHHLGAAVTEAEWDACTEPQKMLDFLYGRASERKLRLVAVACFRRLWHLLTHELGRRAVEVSERYADGGASREELAAAFGAAVQALNRQARPLPPSLALYYARMVAHPEGGVVAGEAAHAAASLAGNVEGRGDYHVRYAEEQAHQSLILRDIFVSPFRPPPRLNPSWLAWEGGTVPRLAAAVYAERAFDRLPVLADALEDAGCADADILGHLRGQGPHVRGCWVLDLLLGRS